MREEIVEALLRLRLLPVKDRPDLEEYDASFEQLQLMGLFAHLLGAKEELGEALRRYFRLTKLEK